MHHRLRAAIAVAVFATLLRAQSYQLVEVAVSPGPLATIDQCALNNQGDVAFVAAPTGASNASVYLWRGAAPSVIAPGSTQRTFLGVALANGRNPITAASDRVNGSPISYFTRKWPATYAGFPLPVGNSQRGDFNSVFGSLDVNDAGYVAFGGLVDGAASTALFLGSSDVVAPIRVVTYPGTVGQFPQLAQDNSIVVRDNQQRIMLWRAGTSTVIADATLGFSTVGQRPGISSDGSMVSFAGIRSARPRGVYVSVPHGGGRQLLTIAGEGSGPFTGITDSERVGVTMSGQMATVTFPGLTAAGSGIYAVDFTIIERNGTLTAMTMPPILVVAMGGQVGGRTITSLNLYDQPNNCGSVVFRAGFGGTAAAVVLAQRTLPAPMFTARVNLVRVLGPGGNISPAWSLPNVIQLESNIDTLCRRLFGVAITGSISDVTDPHAPVSWFNLQSHASAPLIEAFAEGNPCVTGWRTDAINVYLVNSIPGGGGRCSFALGSVANANDLIMLQPRRQIDSAVTLVHELGHYFNLRHTHANLEAGAGGCDGGTAGDCIDDVPPDVAYNSTHTCAALDADLAALYPPGSLEHDVLFRNIMSYRCYSFADATATCGQRLRVLKTALQFRSHVLENHPTPVITTVTPATDRYPGASAIAITGTDLPATGLLQVRLARQGSVVTNVIPNGLNAIFAAPVAPGAHCSCVYRDGQLVAFLDAAPAVRPYAAVGYTPGQLVVRSLNPNGLIVLAFGSSLPAGLTLGAIAYELWVNPNLATAAVPTDAFAFFTMGLPLDPALSGQTIAAQALDLSGTIPTFTNDVIIRFP